MKIEIHTIIKRENNQSDLNFLLPSCQGSKATKNRHGFVKKKINLMNCGIN